MGVPPRTRHEHAEWEVRGEPPAPARGNPTTDKLSARVLAIVVLALLVALVVLIVL